MKVVLNKNAGAFPAGLVLSVPHELGRDLLRRKVAAIIERDLQPDASVTGTFEDALELLGLTANGTSATSAA